MGELIKVGVGDHVVFSRSYGNEMCVATVTKVTAARAYYSDGFRDRFVYLDRIKFRGDAERCKQFAARWNSIAAQAENERRQAYERMARANAALLQKFGEQP
jgi:hypothetical protein